VACGVVEAAWRTCFCGMPANTNICVRAMHAHAQAHDALTHSLQPGRSTCLLLRLYLSSASTPPHSAYRHLPKPDATLSPPSLAVIPRCATPAQRIHGELTRLTRLASNVLSLEKVLPKPETATSIFMASSLVPLYPLLCTQPQRPTPSTYPQALNPIQGKPHHTLCSLELLP
jgi:hypothetical protein